MPASISDFSNGPGIFVWKIQGSRGSNTALRNHSNVWGKCYTTACYSSKLFFKSGKIRGNNGFNTTLNNHSNVHGACSTQQLQTLFQERRGRSTTYFYNSSGDFPNRSYGSSKRPKSLRRSLATPWFHSLEHISFSDSIGDFQDRSHFPDSGVTFFSGLWSFDPKRPKPLTLNHAAVCLHSVEHICVRNVHQNLSPLITYAVLMTRRYQEDPKTSPTLQDQSDARSPRR